MLQAQEQGKSPGQQTRTALIDVATEMFLADGFKAARVADIAQQAGVRLSAINYHFGSKEGLYLAVLQHHADLACSRCSSGCRPSSAAWCGACLILRIRRASAA